MGRLKTMPPRLPSIGNRLATLPREQAEKQRLRERDRNVKWRSWYKSARWEKLRQAVFARDGYICQKTGVLLVGKSPAGNSPVAHHKIPHRGDPALFWDPDNLLTVSKEWHDGPGQAEERREFAALS